jgi:hypothetical protein
MCAEWASTALRNCHDTSSAPLLTLLRPALQFFYIVGDVIHMLVPLSGNLSQYMSPPLGGGDVDSIATTPDGATYLPVGVCAEGASTALQNYHGTTTRRLDVFWKGVSRVLNKNPPCSNILR